MGVRLTKAPVFFTLAQMQFNRVVNLQPHLAALQDAFLKAGYPDYHPAQIEALEVQADAAGVVFNKKSTPRYVYRNKAQTAAVVLDEGALSYELTAYPDSREFLAAFLKALDIVHAHRPIEYFDRLGMRMLDAIQPTEGEDLKKYVVRPALGFAGLIENGMTHKHSQAETVYQNGSQTLVVRTLRLPQGIAVPPDLAPLRTKPDPRFLTHKGEAIILDTDCSHAERTDFSLQATQDRFRELKVALSSAFKAITTPHARRVWK